METRKRKVEIFSAGCSACEETVALVRQLACASCEVAVLNMQDPNVAKRTKRLGIHRVPSVVIDGQLAECCASQAPDEQTLRTAGIGTPLS